MIYRASVRLAMFTNASFARVSRYWGPAIKGVGHMFCNASNFTTYLTRGPRRLELISEWCLYTGCSLAQ